MTEKEPQSVSSTEELDLILLEQLHNVKRQKKIVKRHRKLLGNDPWLEKGDIALNKRIEYFESMISDKTLIKKKHKKKKEKDPDILARSPAYEWYRTAFYTTTFGYRLLMDSISQYMSYFKKGKE